MQNPSASCGSCVLIALIAVLIAALFSLEILMSRNYDSENYQATVQSIYMTNSQVARYIYMTNTQAARYITRTSQSIGNPQSSGSDATVQSIYATNTQIVQYIAQTETARASSGNRTTTPTP